MGYPASGGGGDTSLTAPLQLPAVAGKPYTSAMTTDEAWAHSLSESGYPASMER